MKNLIAATILASGLVLSSTAMSQAGEGKPIVPNGDQPAWMTTPCPTKADRDCYWDPTNPHYQGPSFYNIRIDNQTGLWCRVYFANANGRQNYCAKDGNLQPS